ncbi:hypothetical protein [uncultured Methylobacterium sp.]|uniref:hypothetical protein n=1 Tax=uncultured Methylobacterium sp. TaxID=157278 RepID=UPI0035C9F835
MHKTPRQIAAAARALLRYAGPMVRVRLEWLRERIGCTVAALVAAIPLIETRTFRLLRISGQGSCLAMA